MRVVETQQRHVTVQLGHILYLVAGRGRCGIRLFVWVTECCPSACESDMSKKFNVTESLRYKGVATCGGETTDWSFQLSVILQEICSA